MGAPAVGALAVRRRVGALARSLAWRSGALPAWHRRRNRHSLTVLMFHRVLPQDSAALAEADPVFTLSDTVFAACLAFFRHHYSVVDLAAVAASAAGAATLPPRALLISFDDGWRCNATVVAPLLRAAGLPAAVFLAADPLLDPDPHWWQETLLAALRHGRADYAQLWALAGEDLPAAPDNLALLRRFAPLDREQRARLLAPFAAPRDEGRQMLAPDELAGLAASGVAFGSHGAAHLPLSQLPPAAAAADLDRAARLLRPLADAVGQTLSALSFPHGRYDAATLEAAWRTGCTVALTSDKVLNPAPHGVLASRVLGRISVEGDMVAGRDGRLDPSRLGTWLFDRPLVPAGLGGGGGG